MLKFLYNCTQPIIFGNNSLETVNLPSYSMLKCLCKATNCLLGWNLLSVVIKWVKWCVKWWLFTRFFWARKPFKVHANARAKWMTSFNWFQQSGSKLARIGTIINRQFPIVARSVSHYSTLLKTHYCPSIINSINII